VTVRPWEASSKDAGFVMFIVGNYTMRPKRLPSQYNERPNLSDKREAAFTQGAAADSQLSGLGDRKIRDRIASIPPVVANLCVQATS
jgi:hypothetical protein